MLRLVSHVLSRRLPLLTVAGLLAAAFAVPALAQTADVNRLADRLERIERRMVGLENKTFSTPGAPSARTDLSDYEIRLSELERENTQLYGAVEKLGNAVTALEERLSRTLADLELRLQDIEKQQAALGDVSTLALSLSGQPGGEPGKSPKMPPAIDRPADFQIPEDLPAEDLYRRAYGYLTGARYDVAESWLNTFLKRHPQHDLANNAYYWLGEVLLVQDRTADAIMAFRDGLNAFPDGPKTPAILLKLGVALNKLGQSGHARATWDKLIETYPKSVEAERAQKNLLTLPPAN